MTKFIFATIIVAITSTATYAQVAPKKPAPKMQVVTAPQGTTASPFKNSNDSLSYAIGNNIGNNFAHQGLDNINTSMVKKGIDDVLKNKKLSLDSVQIQTLLMNYSANRRMKQQAESQQKMAAIKAKGQAYLDQNGKRPGVITLPDGLQYEVLRKSDSTKVSPTAQDTVVANYAGTLIDGTEFDNSYKRGEALTIPVGGVIKGWTEILQLMHVGDKFRVVIPSDLGYGDRGAGAQIPGGSVLIFEMELLAIKPAVAVQAAPATAQPGSKGH
ncbi:MAG TPA: FKBP-type peptidyl-prolyl cis-trans isomerase [Ferruginibacter sp.]|jgi:FKBP-type peptidyl-prolyl cis-trans isomerase FklB|nr:FKBP-type peptidyl-prolyl cis-trans isomerase [Ferruginibacter sp.]